MLNFSVLLDSYKLTEIWNGDQALKIIRVLAIGKIMRMFKNNIG